MQQAMAASPVDAHPLVLALAKLLRAHLLARSLGLPPPPLHQLQGEVSSAYSRLMEGVDKGRRDAKRAIKLRDYLASGGVLKPEDEAPPAVPVVPAPQEPIAVPVVVKQEREKPVKVEPQAPVVQPKKEEVIDLTVDSPTPAVVDAMPAPPQDFDFSALLMGSSLGGAGMNFDLPVSGDLDLSSFGLAGLGGSTSFAPTSSSTAAAAALPEPEFDMNAFLASYPSISMPTTSSSSLATSLSGQQLPGMSAADFTMAMGASSGSGTGGGTGSSGIDFASLGLGMDLNFPGLSSTPQLGGLNMSTTSTSGGQGQDTDILASLDAMLASNPSLGGSTSSQAGQGLGIGSGAGSSGAMSSALGGGMLGNEELEELLRSLGS